jgi:hypothetical protein
MEEWAAVCRYVKAVEEEYMRARDGQRHGKNHNADNDDDNYTSESTVS